MKDEVSLWNVYEKIIFTSEQCRKTKLLKNDRKKLYFAPLEMNLQ